jgi:hypothetical protein
LSETKQTPSTILSKSKKPLPPTAKSEKAEKRAARLLKLEKEEKEDAARVRDVVEGWKGDGVVGGMEFERNLRKVAQRGGEFIIFGGRKDAEYSDKTI